LVSLSLLTRSTKKDREKNFCFRLRGFRVFPAGVGEADEKSRSKPPNPILGARPMTLQNINKTLLGCLATLLIAAATATPASAQSAGSWVDIFKGGAGAGASAEGDFQYAKSKSSSKNGVQFGHGLAVGAGPNGIAISNSIGAGAGPLGVAHNVNLNIGANGTHVSHGGVVSQGGSRRVTSGGSTGVRNGQVYGGSNSTGYGTRTKAWSKSHTNNWGQPTGPFQTTSQAVAPSTVQGQQTYYNNAPVQRSQPSRRIVSGFRIR
jgi:hypothetical protein